MTIIMFLEEGHRVCNINIAAVQAMRCVHTHAMAHKYIYEPVTKGRDLKWDTLPQNQTPSKLFSVLPLESGMFQVTISIIKKWF